jgi:hypothetical protein
MSWTLKVNADEETGDLILEFPDDLIDSVGWKAGDTIVWTDNKDGSWSLRKKDATSDNASV